MDTTGAAVLVALALVTCFALIARKVLSTRTPEVDFGQWLEEFSLARYRPMERLLTEDDETFLRSQPGHSPALSNRLRTERRRLFRRYLKNLRRDFQQLHQVARLMILYSPVDRPELAETLLRIRISFVLALMSVEWRLFLHALGAKGVEVQGLLDTVQGLESRLRVQATAA